MCDGRWFNVSINVNGQDEGVDEAVTFGGTGKYFERYPETPRPLFPGGILQAAGLGGGENGRRAMAMARVAKRRG
jgi:hypothetical protein